MKPIHSYGHQLSDEQIAQNAHRDFVGGMWEELGELQFEFLRQQGLKTSDRLLDVGCGALRGGLHFVRFLDAGNYHGIDMNPSLLAAGRLELERAGLQDRKAHLLANEAFEFERFGKRFDMAIALSVFTHLPANHIVRCLAEIRKVLAPGAGFFATVFLAPSSAFLSPLTHSPGGIVTHYDADPYHYGIEELGMLAALSGVDIELIGNWNHPRNQQMVCIRSRG